MRTATILSSFAYFAKADLAGLTRRAREQGVTVDFMADSGAFTAFTTGKVIGLKNYATWLLMHGPLINCAMTLDVIGNPAASGRNTLELEQLVGDSTYVIPIFHVGSPWSELERWCKSHPFVALGGGVAVGQRENAFLQWLIRCHKIARDNGAVLHGLGMTKPPYPDLLPFYSVDSSFWSLGGRTGSVTLFDERRKRWTCVRNSNNTTQAAIKHSRLVRTYGGDPVALAKPGFGLVRVNGKEQARAEREWMSAAAVESWMRYADHLGMKHRTVPAPGSVFGNGPKVYLAVGGEGDFDMITRVAATYQPQPLGNMS